MELFFNELSIKGKESIGRDSAVILAGVYRELREYNITTCRIDSMDHLKLFQMIQNLPDSVNIKNFSEKRSWDGCIDGIFKTPCSMSVCHRDSQFFTV